MSDDELRRRFKSGASSPRITSIRFPHFKALEPNLQIDFTFPITALVGQNGSNKSSILHALDSAPEGRSLANHWFSTKLDPIGRLDSKSQQRFVYTYDIRIGSEEHIAEVRKSRVTKPFRNEWVPKLLLGQRDPDYWEPTKRVDVDGMRELPTDEKLQPYLTKDRWNAIKKEVVYIDFRGELSAYDKFVHHAAPDKWTQNPTGRRYRVITRSAELALAFKELKPTSDKILSPPRMIDDACVATISQILGKKFSEIRVVKHRCYGVIGHSAQMKFGDRSYSEAHAGSGEFAIIRLVDEISQAPNKTLILLDEPEVSLHPGAQVALMEYLRHVCRTRGHQVVLSTHSPTIVDGLPPEAVKLLGTNGRDSTVRLLSQSTPSHHAFFNLGYVTNRPSGKVLVEDVFVVEVVKSAMRAFDPSSLPYVDPVALPGGASRIIQTTIPSFAAAGATGVCVLLDGDQFPDEWNDEESSTYSIRLPDWSRIDSMATKADSAYEAAILVEKWRALVTELLGPKVHFDIHGRTDDKYRSDINEIEEIHRNLKWCAKHMKFLAGKVPEAALLHELDGAYDPYTPTKETKGHFVVLTARELGKESDYEAPTSADILATQQRKLAELVKSRGKESLLLASAFRAVEAVLPPGHG
ncbi:ATP-binding protein [Nocardia nova]|uniref:ATP-binding protein n=1 Tax=Nocardia nova TaxID=37330 RepID=UPI00371D02F9